MAVILGPPPMQTPITEYVWKQWLQRLSENIGSSGTTGIFTDLDFNGSNLTSILTRNHNDLQNMSGGGSGERYHMTSAQSDMVLDSTDTITAGATQTQAGATALTKGANRVTVSGIDGDGVKLPTAVAGHRVLIINADSAQTIQVWPNTSDAIDGGSADAVDSNTLTEGFAREYVAMDATNWYTINYE